MTTKYHYGTAIVSSGLGILAGILIRKSMEARDIDAAARAKGFIKPEECPPPCPPFDQIIEEGQCVRCGGRWIPPTGPYSKGECIPPSSGGSGAGSGGLQPPLIQPPAGGGAGGGVQPPLQPGDGAGAGAGTGYGGSGPTVPYNPSGSGTTAGGASRAPLPPIG